MEDYEVPIVKYNRAILYMIQATKACSKACDTLRVDAELEDENRDCLSKKLKKLDFSTKNEKEKEALA